jgi:hypothetical protein
MAVTPEDRTNAINRLLPRYRYGVILPGTGGVQRGVDYQFYRLAPPDVMQIGVGLGIREYSDVNPESAREALWNPGTCRGRRTPKRTNWPSSP